MLISKFDLYRSEWLDLVFSDRNKAYGAYELRHDHSRIMLKALGIMFVSILVVAFVFGVILKKAIPPKPRGGDTMIQVTTVLPPPPPVTPPAKRPLADQPKPPSTPHQQVASAKLVQMVVTSDSKAEEPPKLSELEGKVISNTNQTGPASTTSTVDATPGPSGPPGPAEDNSIHPGGIGLEREPLPVGGFAAFEKFLRKHLRYPDEASEAHIQGKVFMSFIIEKDGSLSNITIIRGPGYGTNEEALRVLKLAPAWDPGIQNNHPVRVQYTIPINFQMGDDEP